MPKLRWLRVAVGIGVAFIAIVAVRRCDPLCRPPTSATRAICVRESSSRTSRCIPAPGGSITIKLAPDLDAGVSVTRAVAWLRISPGLTSE